MDIILNEFLATLVSIAGTALATLACVGIGYLINWIKTKTESEKIKQMLDDLEATVTDGINFVEQTAVKEFKASGTWNSKTQEKVLQLCANYIEKNLAPQTLEFLTVDKDDLRDYLIEQIEAKLGKIHTAK